MLRQLVFWGGLLLFLVRGILEVRAERVDAIAVFSEVALKEQVVLIVLIFLTFRMTTVSPEELIVVLFVVFRTHTLFVV